MLNNLGYLHASSSSLSQAENPQRGQLSFRDQKSNTFRVGIPVSNHSKLTGSNYIELQCAMLGCVTFVLLHGIAILDPTFIGWLLTRDSATHFLGWHFFRSEPWIFPLGAIQSYMYPHGTSIVFTDSLPLLALPLKLLSPLLPHPFQYLGLWSLISYILQGYFAAKLVRQITNNHALILIGSLFFLLLPVMQRKALSHNALASHWLILAALYLYFCQENSAKRYQWLILLVSSSLIHFYLLFMAGIIWGAYLWRLKRDGTSVIKMMAINIGAVLMAMWGTGYFVIGVSATSASGYGVVSMMNLLAPIIPPFNSRFTFNPVNFLPAISSDLLGQREGFNYLGLGTIGIAALALYQYLTNSLVLGEIKKHRPLVFSTFFLLILAISNKVTFYDSVLMEISTPLFLKKALGIMHAGGRLFWPFAYLLILSSIAIICKVNRERRAIYIMLFMIIIQWIDVWPCRNNISRTSPQFQNPLQSEEWIKIASNIKHIKIMPPERNGDDYLPFALLAANNGKTINIGFAARSGPEQTKFQTKDFDDFKTGKYNDDTLYIIKKDSYSNIPVITGGFTLKILDGYHIVTKL